MTYVTQKVRAWSCKKTEKHQLKFLLVGDGMNLQDMQALMEKHRFQYDVFHSRKNDLPSSDVLYRDYDYVVFDTERFPFCSILDFFRHDAPGRQHPTISTYIPSNKSIMTFHGALN